MQRVLALLILLLMVTSRLHAQDALLLEPDLEPRRVTFRALTDQGIELADPQGRVQTLGFEQVLRLTLPAPAGLQQAPADRAVATLVDGQVLVGRLLGPGEDGESIKMSLTLDQREIDLPLDHLMHLSLYNGARLPAALEDDAVLLATGETLVGFVESIGVGTIGFVVGDADEPIPVPLDRVRAVAIANKPKPLQPTNQQRLVRVRLHDGSAYLLQDAETAPPSSTDALRLAGLSVLPLSVPAMSIPMAQVQRIEPMTVQQELVALSTLTMQLIDGGEVFGVAMPPRVDTTGDIRLHAPATVGFELPQGTGRVVFEASLDLGDDVSPARRALAGCDVVVLDGDKPVARTTLRPDNPPQRINAPLTGGTLRIRIEPGENGPVLDRVRLSLAEVLVRRP